MPRGSRAATRHRAGAGHHCERPRDRGNIVVLEAVIAAILLVGVATVLLAATGPDTRNSNDATTELQTLSKDILRTLEATDGNESRRSHLPDLVADALHGRSDELENRTHRLLPRGAEASVALSNGLDRMYLLDNGPAPEEATGARQPEAFRWPTLHVVPEMRVYPSDVEVDMNVTALPLWGSSPKDRAALEENNLSFPNGFEATLDEDGAASGTLANLSLQNASDSGGDGFPQDPVVTITSNTTYRNETLEGEATYETDGAGVVDDAHGPATDNLSEATLSVTPGDVDVGDDVTLDWDLGPVADAVDEHTAAGTDEEVHVSVFRPIPRDEEPAANRSAAYHFGDRATDGSQDVSLDRGEVVGRWMVVAQLNYTLDASGGEINQSARLVETFTVRKPGTTGDPTALYDLELVAWYEDG